MVIVKLNLQELLKAILHVSLQLLLLNQLIEVIVKLNHQYLPILNLPILNPTINLKIVQ